MFLIIEFSPHISVVLPLRKLCLSVIPSDVIYSEPFPDAQYRMRGNVLHTSRHLKCGSVPGGPLITAMCDDTKV